MRRRKSALIKSNNPHLAGGEKRETSTGTPAGHDGIERFSSGKKKERKKETSTEPKKREKKRQAPEPQPEPGGTSKS